MRINNPLQHTTLAIVLTSTTIVALFSVVTETYAQSIESTTTFSSRVRPVKLIQVGNVGTQIHKTFPAKVAANQQVDLAFRINAYFGAFRSVISGLSDHPFRFKPIT
ncbi:hypothetical protein L9W94_19340, partial [Vibrio aestuarianus]|nr:hypothetical protein [Vibrio aestuarianus]